MSQERKVTDQQFSDMREMLAAAECVTKTVPLSAISLDKDSLKLGEIHISGQRVKVASGFFKRLASLVKINDSMTKEMMKNEDHAIATAMINGLKDYRQAKGSGEVLLIANPTTMEIVDICEPNKFRRLTNDSMFDITARIMNESPGLIIETINFDARNGTSSINLLNSKEIGFPGAGKDEFFKFGFSIVQSRRDTLVEMYNQRLVCTNGMRMNLGSGAIGGNQNINFEERFRLNSNKADDVRAFLGRINDMQKAEFVPGAFKSALTSAVETKASLLEVEGSMLKAQRMVHEEDPALKKNYIDAIGRNYFHAHGDAVQRVAQKGFNPLSLNDKQKSYIKTNMSVWDVVNSMTYLGSNNSGIPLSNQHELKKDAGDLFGKVTRSGFDLQFSQFATI